MEMHTNTADMLVVGVSKRAITQSGLYQILAMLTAERYVPAARQGDGNVV